MPEFQKFEELVKNENLLNKHLNRHVGTFLNTINSSTLDLVLFTMAKILELSDNGKQPKITINQIYQDLNKIIYYDKIPILDIVPLHNFDSDN